MQLDESSTIEEARGSIVTEDIIWRRVVALGGVTAVLGASAASLMTPSSTNLVVSGSEVRISGAPRKNWLQ